MINCFWIRNFHTLEAVGAVPQKKERLITRRTLVINNSSRIMAVQLL